MTAIELGGIITGGVVALGALIVAIGQISKGLKQFWRFLVKTVKTVDIISRIPDRLDAQDVLLTKLQKNLWEHITYADGRNELLDEVKHTTEELLALGRDVHHEVKHNGGSSIKDAVSRIETGVKGLYTPAGSTGPVAVIIPRENAS